MTRRTLAIVLTTAMLALLLAAVAPRAEAVSFVDKQVQAGSLLIQKYVNDYGQSHRFLYPPKSMVKKGGGLPGSTAIWPSNPWTGKVMAPGTSRGAYTYAPSASGATYKLVVHLSSGNWTLKGGVPSWFKPERNTASLQNLLLLQRYVEAHAASHGGAYPAAADVSAVAFGTSFVWPKNPWTGADMVAGATAGDYAYTPLSGGSGYSLKVMLTGGWSTVLGPLPTLGQLTTTPGG
jgi:hypothetical protein